MTEKIIARHGMSKLVDATARRRHGTYEAFYEFSGGAIYGTISQKPDEPWKLNLVSCVDDFDDPEERPEDFDQWQDAWEYLTDRLDDIG